MSNGQRKKTAKKAAVKPAEPEVIDAPKEEAPEVKPTPKVVLDTNLGKRTVIRLDGNSIDLTEIHEKGLAIIDEVAKNAGSKLKEDLQPIADKVQDIVGNSLPKIAKLAAAKLAAGTSLAETTKLVKALLEGEKQALSGLANAARLRISTVSEAAFFETAEKTIKLLVNVAASVVKYL